MSGHCMIMMGKNKMSLASEQVRGLTLNSPFFSCLTGLVIYSTWGFWNFGGEMLLQATCGSFKFYKSIMTEFPNQGFVMALQGVCETVITMSVTHESKFYIIQ